MSRSNFKLSIFLSLAHGVADGAAGLLLASLAYLMPLVEVAQLVLLYNILTFGGQPVVGLLTDRQTRPRRAAIGGLLLLSLALLVSTWSPKIAVILAGFGSAAFHVGGGAIALYVTPKQATGPGIFAAPGVLGLAIGGALATLGYVNFWPFLLLLLLFAAIITYPPLPELPYSKGNHVFSDSVFEAHDYVMMVLLAAMALRSAVWTLFQSLMLGDMNVLLGMGIAAAIGKILGGILADKFGWRRWGVGALLVAAPLLSIGSSNIGVLMLGIGLLQSTVPVMIAAMGQASPQFPATASGLAFGLALAFGSLPQITGIETQMNSPPILLGLILISAGLLWWGIQKKLFFDLDTEFGY